jgi:PAS domain S-box-containing protein
MVGLDTHLKGLTPMPIEAVFRFLWQRKLLFIGIVSAVLVYLFLIWAQISPIIPIYAFFENAAPFHLDELMTALLVLFIFVSSHFFLMARKELMAVRCSEESICQSEQRYKELADSLPEIVFEADEAGSVRFYNERASEIFGYGKDEFSRFNIFQFVVPEDLARAKENIEKVLRGERSGGNEYTFMTKDGRTFPGLVFSKAITEMNGTRGLRGIVIDISELKKAEETMRESQRKFEQLFMKNPEATVYLDDEYRVLEVNPRFGELFGYSSDEAKGKNIDDLIVPKDRVEEFERLKIEGKEGFIYHDTMRRRKDGTLIPVSLSAAPVVIGDRNTGYIVLYKDIRERVELQGRLKEYSQRLEGLVEARTEQLRESQKKLLVTERFAAIGELAGMVGHDLRNPLMSIAGAEFYLRTSLEPQLKAEEMKMLNIIEEDIAYSNKIVNDLQDYSKDLRLEMTTTSPRRLLEESLTVINVPRNIQILNETREKPKINVDSSKIKRVFINVIKNAFEAMPNGGRLEVSTNERDGVVEFAFKDTGAGIPEKILEKIGKPLFTTKARGMGFGLAICFRIVEAHKGRICIESTVGKGTTVHVFIPMNQENQQMPEWIISKATPLESQSKETEALDLADERV